MNYLQSAYDATEGEVYFRLGNEGVSEDVNAFLSTNFHIAVPTGDPAP